MSDDKYKRFHDRLIQQLDERMQSHWPESEWANIEEMADDIVSQCVGERELRREAVKVAERCWKKLRATEDAMKRYGAYDADEIKRLRKIIETQAKQQQHLAVNEAFTIQMSESREGVISWVVACWPDKCLIELSRHADLWDAIRAAEEAGK